MTPNIWECSSKHISITVDLALTDPYIFSISVLYHRFIYIKIKHIVFSNKINTTKKLVSIKLFLTIFLLFKGLHWTPKVDWKGSCPLFHNIYTSGILYHVFWTKSYTLFVLSKELSIALTCKISQSVHN